MISHECSTARISSTSSAANIYGFEVLLGFGTGAFIQSGYAVIQAVVDPSNMSYAISFIMICMICIGSTRLVANS